MSLRLTLRVAQIAIGTALLLWLAHATERPDPSVAVHHTSQVEAGVQPRR